MPFKVLILVYVQYSRPNETCLDYWSSYITSLSHLQYKNKLEKQAIKILSGKKKTAFSNQLETNEIHIWLKTKNTNTLKHSVGLKLGKKWVDYCDNEPSSSQFPQVWLSQGNVEDGRVRSSQFHIKSAERGAGESKSVCRLDGTRDVWWGVLYLGVTPSKF